MQYYTFILIGKSSSNILWFADTWSIAFGSLNLIVEEYKKKVGIRSIQGLWEDKEQIRFGKLNWDTKSSNKWTLNRDTRSQSDIQFFSTEIWLPRWTVCTKENISPFIFMNIEDPFPLKQYPPKEGQFNQYFQFSIREDKYNQYKTQLEKIFQEVYGHIEGVLSIWIKTNWNEQGYSLMDAINNYVRYVGMNEDLIPNKTKMMVDWHGYEIGTALPN
jgi:hypothetical protein